MLKKAWSLCQKKQTQASFIAAAGKTGNEEKWAHAAMEYLFEKNHVNDPKKRIPDVQAEVKTALAYDRYHHVAHEAFAYRMGRLISRMNDAMAAIPSDALREEALQLNSQQFPLNFRRPSLTPPLFGYEPGFGLDVPQLRTQIAEYPAVIRPTDALEFAGGGGSSDANERDSSSSASGATEEGSEGNFPIVDAEQMSALTKSCAAALEDEHGELREAAPTTGVEGEGFEAYMALWKKALARQQLLLDLSNDPELNERYQNDEAFRVTCLAERGIRSLEHESVPVDRLKVERHYAQEPHYHPFRKF